MKKPAKPAVILPISNELLERAIQLVLYTDKLSVWDAQHIYNTMKLGNIDKEKFNNDYREGLVKAALSVFGKVCELRSIDGKLLADSMLESSDVSTDILNTLSDEIANDKVELTEDTANYIVDSFSDLAGSQELYSYKEPLKAMVEEIENLDETNARTLRGKFNNTIMPIVSRLSLSENSRKEDDMIIFGEESFIKSNDKAIEEKKNPAMVIRTGCRELNHILDGGFRAGRVYVFMGAPGTGKSLTLENVLYWACSMQNLSNVNIPDGKKPYVMFVTQENSIEESDERQYSVGLPEEVSTEKDFEERSGEELYQLYIKHGWKIPFCRMYYDNMSINAATIEGDIEKMELRGYHCILLIHDYLKRIRAVDHIDDPTYDIGSAVNDFKILAKRKKIPVVDAAQIQREAVRKATELAQKGQSFEGKFSGADMGNSIAAYENADGTFMLGNIKDPATDVRYMMMCKLKLRYKSKAKYNMVAIPFEGETARLVCNFGKNEAMGVKTTWGDRFEEAKPTVTKGSRFKKIVRNDD
jgi:hypothetical protein